MKQKIIFMGAGNMARAIVQGILSNHALCENLAEIVFIDHAMQESSSTKIQAFNDLHAELPLHLQSLKFSYYENVAAFNQYLNKSLNKSLNKNFDLLILAIKPQGLNAFADEVAATAERFEFFEKIDVVLSIMAGTSIAKIADCLKLAPEKIVRAMPNTPISVGFGSTALYMNQNPNLNQNNDIKNYISNENIKLIENIFQSAGKTLWLQNEAHMHEFTALCGSAPAYMFYILQAMVEQAADWGLPSEILHAHIVQTMQGACKMAADDLIAKHSPQSLIDLRLNVTSKGGTTQAAIESFENNKMASGDLIASLSNHIKEGLEAAKKRSQNL